MIRLSMCTDNVRALVEKVKTGDRKAFNHLYERFYIPLCSYASLLIERDEAKDVVQDVFVNIWIRREYIDTSLSFHGYLLRSVYNSSLNVLKRKDYSREYQSVYRKKIEQMGHLFYNPDTNETIQHLYNEDLRATLEAAINSLPERCREIFRLSYIDGLPGKEISSKLNISLSTVENHIYSALKQLRSKLKEYVLFLFMIFII